MGHVRPRVSVIIPAYNAEPFIRAAIESVLAQTYRAGEILVVDDGSTDGTAAAVQPFHPHVRLINQVNQGPSAARNTGILSSSGELLAFLDADDIWCPEFLQQAVSLLEARPGVDVVYTWAQFVDQDGGLLPDRLCSSLESLTLRRLLLGGDPVLFSSVVARRSAFARVGLFDPSLRQAEDWDMILRMVAAGIRFASIPRALVYRRVHPDSVTADAGSALPWERSALRKALDTLPLPSDCQGLAPQATFRILQRAAMAYWRRGDRRTAVERLLEGFAEWPAALARPQTYLGLISRLLPSGFKDDGTVLRDLDRLRDEAVRLLGEVFGSPDLPPVVRSRERAAWSALHAALALLFLRRRSWRSALAHGARSLWLHPIPPLQGGVLAARRAAAKSVGLLRVPAVLDDRGQGSPLG
ncbi:MAG: glycosyltransferase family A protein [Armatimonadota bacterium]|nr:glycosyltransferase family A protein [Armatimonadota bacterium]